MYLRNTQIRVTLDYEEDLLFFKKVINTLKNENLEEKLYILIKLINSDPTLLNINKHKHEDYLKKQTKGSINENTTSSI